MSEPVGANSVRRLSDQGAQIVEVLPADEYGQLQLPGGINLPLKELDAATAAERLDPRVAVVVYCWDPL